MSSISITTFVPASRIRNGAWFKRLGFTKTFPSDTIDSYLTILMEETQKLKIGVLYGGFSSERAVSLLSGENVAKNLSRTTYAVTTIDVVDETHWQLKGEEGPPFVLDMSTGEARALLQDFDVFFNVLHGKYGEDGQLQIFLDSLGVQYTGSGVVASQLTMDKITAMERGREAGLLVPDYFPFDATSKEKELQKKIKESFDYPVIVKPNDSGSTLGLSLVQNEKELALALKKALAESSRAIIQQYIFGREFTSGILANRGGTEATLLPPVEIIIKNKIFDYNDKYFSKETQELCPAPIDTFLAEKIKSLAFLAHRTFGCDGLSRSDFRMDGIGRLFFLETNSSPGMTEASLCPKEALAAGMTLAELLDDMVDLAVKRGVVQ